MSPTRHVRAAPSGVAAVAAADRAAVAPDEVALNRSIQKRIRFSREKARFSAGFFSCADLAGYLQTSGIVYVAVRGDETTNARR
jgi:hypothetical protein